MDGAVKEFKQLIISKLFWLPCQFSIKMRQSKKVFSINTIDKVFPFGNYADKKGFY